MDYSAEKGNGCYTMHDYLQGKLPGQTASFLYRNYFKEKHLFDYLHQNDRHPLDRFIAFVAVSNGVVFCNNYKWSAYRYITDGGSSFSAKHDGMSRKAADSVLKYHRSLYEYAVLEQKGRLCIRTSEKLYYKSYLRDWFLNDCRHVGRMLREVMRARYPLTTFFWIFLQLVVMVRKHEGYIYEK